MHFNSEYCTHGTGTFPWVRGRNFAVIAAGAAVDFYSQNHQKCF